jgi:hypothetical protein
VLGQRDHVHRSINKGVIVAQPTAARHVTPFWSGSANRPL